MDERRKAKLDPKCLNGKQAAYAMTNKGELIPCCWLDTQEQRAEQDYQEFLWASRIDDYDSIEEIFLTDEWVEFFKNLKEGRGFLKCHDICKWRENDSHKHETFMDAKTKKKTRKKTT